MKRIFSVVSRVAIVAMTAMLVVGCSEDTTDDDSTSTDESDVVMAKWVDEKLESYYLYNEEYKTMDRDLTLLYSNLFYNSLISMSTNVLDKKYDAESDTYSLYSYIYRTVEDSTKSGLMSSDEDLLSSVGYGFATLGVAYDESYNIVYTVESVYPDSPAYDIGLRRGALIYGVNGQSISADNYGELYIALYYGVSEGDQVTLDVNVTEDEIISLTLTATDVALNPVLHCEVIDERVGYLVYLSFETAFEQELRDALASLKAANVSEFILDLRYNGGGYTTISNLLASAIGGVSESGKVFSYYRFNQDLTDNSSSTSAIMGYKFDSSKGLFYDEFTLDSEISLDGVGNHIYCLVSEGTASASEAVINSLRGVGYEVTLIGIDTKTHGKNVGMTVFSANYDGYDYEIAPVAFEVYNALEQGDYSEGFEVDYLVDQYWGFADYGVNEPLVAKALELMGVTEPSMQSRAMGSSVGLTSIERYNAPHRRVGSINIAKEL